MTFTTSFDIPHHPRPINHQSSMVMMGSCFSQNMGDKLRYFGFNTTINPFGVIFNPHNMAVLVDKSLNDSFTQKDVHGHFSYLAHSYLDAIDPNQVLINLKKAGAILKKEIENASHFIMTLGTAWIYQLKENGQIVANCHQQPQGLFDKRLLTTEEIVTALQQIQELIKAANPSIQLIYTLSPVRHIKDGIVENSRSKARLRDAIQQQCETANAYYFPSFEILMDELRDYRFYAGDMIHPNETAVDYVWSRFRESVIDTNCNPTLKAIEKYRKLSLHRPKNTTAHELQLDEMRSNLIKDFPYLKL